MKRKGRELNANDNQVDETEGARLHYESAALPTELRRPALDSKWEGDKRKARERVSGAEQNQLNER
jgi:hypothetical protein